MTKLRDGESGIAYQTRRSRLALYTLMDVCRGYCWALVCARYAAERNIVADGVFRNVDAVFE